MRALWRGPITRAIANANSPSAAGRAGEGGPRDPAQLVERKLSSYFADQPDGLPPAGLYDRVLEEVERPLIQLTLSPPVATRSREISGSTEHPAQENSDLGVRCSAADSRGTLPRRGSLSEIRPWRRLAGTSHWYELVTADPGRRGAFYSKVVGWGLQDVGQACPYTLLQVNGKAVAGIAPRPTASGGVSRPAGWYVAVDDVDGFAVRFGRPAEVLTSDGHSRHPALPTVADSARRCLHPLQGLCRRGPPKGGRNDAGFFGWRELWAATAPRPSTSMPACSAGPRPRP